MNDGEEKVIYECYLNMANKLRFTVNKFKGKEYYHVRTYVHCTINGDKYLPTPKGIAMTKEVLDGFFNGVLALSEYVKNNP